MSEITEQVGQLIREARRSKGLTQKELGARLGISEAAINKYENNGQNMTLQTLNKLAEALDLKLKVMFEE